MIKYPAQMSKHQEGMRECFKYCVLHGLCLRSGSDNDKRREDHAYHLGFYAGRASAHYRRCYGRKVPSFHDEVLTEVKRLDAEISSL